MQTETSCLLMLATLYDVDDDVDYDSNKISTGGLERIMISSLLRSFGLAGFGSIILLENEKRWNSATQILKTFRREKNESCRVCCYLNVYRDFTSLDS